MAPPEGSIVEQSDGDATSNREFWCTVIQQSLGAPNAALVKTPTNLRVGFRARKKPLAQAQLSDLAKCAIFSLGRRGKAELS
jgi:hypothetical protein